MQLLYDLTVYLLSTNWQDIIKWLGLGLLVYYIIWVIYSRHFHPYRDIPGPFLASITSWWYFRTIRYGIRDNSQKALHEKYGEFVRIAPNEVQISDPTAMDIIYKPQFLKTEFYDSFSPPGKDKHEVFTERDERIHSVLRKKLAPLFRLESLSPYEPYIQNVVGILEARLDTLVEGKEIFDLSVYLRKFAFDTIGEMFYSKEGGFGFLRDDVDYNGWMEMLDLMPPIVSSLGYIPYGMKAPYLLSQLVLSLHTRRGVASAALVEKQAVEIVRQRKDEEAAGQEFREDGFLSKLMLLSRSEKSNFTETDVEIVIRDFVWAGSDSTGNALTSILYPILKHPEVCRKLVQEIDEAMNDEKISKPICYRDAVKLPYLTACIHEAIRVLPGNGTGFPRYVPPGGAMISGKFFPGGYKVNMNPNVIHFDKAVFGDDTDEFRPERWIENDEAKLAYMLRHLMNFGLGGRVCLGKQLAMMEIYRLIPSVLRRYHFDLMSPKLQIIHSWFQAPTRLMVRATRRIHN